jgi:hypothetical protein
MLMLVDMCPPGIIAKPHNETGDAILPLPLSSLASRIPQIAFLVAGLRDRSFELGSLDIRRRTPAPVYAGPSSLGPPSAVESVDSSFHVQKRHIANSVPQPQFCIFHSCNGSSVFTKRHTDFGNERTPILRNPLEGVRDGHPPDFPLGLEILQVNLRDRFSRLWL